MKERVEEIKRKVEEGSAKVDENSTDLIEAITKDSLKKKPEGEMIYSNQDIIDEFSTFFIAGVDTTSNYITMMIYLIKQHPEVENKVREEIAEFMADEDYSYDNLKKLTYIDCVQKEVTRHFGPANFIFTREAIKDHFLKGVPVYKGTLFGVQPLGTHYSEKYYKSPLEFRPERWIEECNDVPIYAIGGFSGGPRTCIGKHLAKLEAKIGLIKFLKRFEKIEIPKEKIELYFRFMYQPKSYKSKLGNKQE